MSNGSDFDLDVLIKKRNRRSVKEADKNRMVVGPRPVSILRKEPRKQKERRTNLAIKDAFKISF